MQLPISCLCTSVGSPPPSHTFEEIPPITYSSTQETDVKIIIKYRVGSYHSYCMMRVLLDVVVMGCKLVSRCWTAWLAQGPFPSPHASSPEVETHSASYQSIRAKLES